MRAYIQDLEYSLPDLVLTNDALKLKNPHWNIQHIEQRAGVFSRHIAGPNETALDFAYRASLKLLDRNPDLRAKIDAVIFCTQSGDHILPSNACLLHKLLELPDEVIAYDFNLACSGFIYGLSIVQGLISSKQARNILLVTGDTYSKYIHAQDRAAGALFGDGTAVTWFVGSEDDGLVDLICATSGKDSDKFIIPAGGCRKQRSPETAIPIRDLGGNVRTLEHIHMDGMGVLSFVKEKIPRQVETLLNRNGLSLATVDRIIFHQASKVALDWLDGFFQIEAGKSFRNLSHIGNTVSASIPIALKDAIDQGQVRPGHKVLLVGFGVGLSYASAIIRI